LRASYHGHVVGSYLGEMDGKGFIWREGTWTFVAGPSDTVSSTQLEGINDPGLMVGVWHDNQGQHAFVSDGVTFTELVVPGALYTRVDGINNRGQIVGAYQDAEGGIHGFLAEPAHEAPGQ
jgi:uncharacterized membrane protein